MRGGHLRAAAVLVLVSFAPQALGNDIRDTVDDAPRAASAPLDLPPGEDVVEVASALFWMRLQDGKTSSHATKAGAGVYFTREAYERANGAFRERGRERDALRLQVEELSSRPLPVVPVVPSCAADAYPPPAFVTGRWPTWAVVGVGVLAAGAGVALGVCLSGGCR